MGGCVAPFSFVTPLAGCLSGVAPDGWIGVTSQNRVRKSPMKKAMAPKDALSRLFLRNTRIMGKKIYHGITFLTWNVNEKNNLSLTVNPDPKLISQRNLP